MTPQPATPQPEPRHPVSTSDPSAPAYHGNEIAIIGWAGRFPQSRSVAVLWEHLVAGNECISFLDSATLQERGVADQVFRDAQYVPAAGIAPDIDRFDASFFGFSPKEAAMMDPQHRLFLEHAWEAMEFAGYNPEENGATIGVYAGVGLNSYLLDYVYPQLLSGEGNPFQALIRNDKDFLPTLTAYKLNLRGPCVAVQTACSTSLVAVHLACQSLLSGECDMALAGSASITANPKGYRYEAGMIMSPDGHCRAFDADAQGTVGGSGVGIVLLKRLAEAIADGDTVYAVIKGSAVNNDGQNKVGYTAPSVTGQAAVIAEALAIAGVDADSINYVEAHGTATTLGDPIEISALTQAFRQQTQRQGFCAIGSVKTNVGHLDTAAGVTGLLKTANALYHGFLPPSLHFKNPNPALNLLNSPFYVNTQLQPWPDQSTPHRAGVSAFGIGGTNAHVILEAPPPPVVQPSAQSHHVLFLSARTPTALQQSCQQLATHLQTHPEYELADVAYTLAIGRKAFDVRRAIVVADRHSAIQALQDYAMAMEDLSQAIHQPESSESEKLTARSTLNAPLTESQSSSISSSTSSPISTSLAVAFLLSGQGSQYVGMGRELYELEPVYRHLIDQAAQILQPILNCDIREILYPPIDQPGRLKSATAQLQKTALTQPILFAVEYALANLWLHWGIKPQALIGHSIGEYVAACLANVFSFEDGLKLAAQRGQLMQRLPAGAMLGVALTEADVQPWLSADVSLAAVNGATCTLSGSIAAISRLTQQLTKAGIQVHPLHTSHAFHSPAMEPILAEFAAVLATVKWQHPTCSYLSNLTGDWITPEAATNPQYWVQHLRQTVRFGDGIAKLLADPAYILLEVGPGKTLATLARRHPMAQSNTQILTSLPHPTQNNGASETARKALAMLWQQGINCDRRHLYPKEQRRRVSIPTYPFERQRHWLDAPDWSQVGSSANRGFPRLLDANQWFYAPTWIRSGSVQEELCQLVAGQTWLIFSDHCGFSPWLCQTLEGQQQRVISVVTGPEWAILSPTQFQLNPQDPAQYHQLFTLLKAQDQLPDYLIHAWTVTHTESQPLELGIIQSLQQLGLHSLLAIAQTIGKVCPRQLLRLVTLSNGLYELTGQEFLSPAKATILGATKAIPLEYPNIICSSIDIDWPANDTVPVLRRVAHLISTVCNRQVPLELAYRGTYRWDLQYRPAPMTELGNESPLRLRPRGVYLITGGLGGIGLTLAMYLARTVQAKLILVSRTSCLARSEWQTWLDTHTNPNDKTRQLITAVQELESAGAEVQICTADVTDLAQMNTVLQQAEQRFGAIHGVLHCAGIVDHAGVIQSRTADQTDAVLATKLQGTLVLAHLLRERSLDFWVMSASLSTVLSSSLFGQVGYGAANEFLTAFSHYYRQTAGIWTTAIQWTEWAEVGMAAAARDRLAQSSTAPDVLSRLTPAEGMAAFAKILSGASAQIAVCPQDLVGLCEEQTKLYQSLAIVPPASVPSESSASSAPSASTVIMADIVAQLCQAWQICLGVATVQPQDNFFDLGGDSLLGLGLLSQIQQQLQIVIPITALIEAPTPQSLAHYLQENYPELSLASDESDANDVADPAILASEPPIFDDLWLDPVSSLDASPVPTISRPPSETIDRMPMAVLAPPQTQRQSSSRPTLSVSPPVAPNSTASDTRFLLLKQVNPQATPLYLIHPIGGGVTCYRHLVNYLPADRPIYGIQAQGLEGEAQPYNDLKQMAQHYVQTLRQRQPKGPYLLGGWSMGGVVAYEMSCQLQAIGETVQGLLLIDSPAPIQVDRAPNMLQQLSVFGRSLGFTLAQTRQCLAGLPPELSSPVAYLQQFGEQGRHLDLLPSVIDQGILQNLFAVFQANTQALNHYVGQPSEFQSLVRLILAQSGEFTSRLPWPWATERITDAQTVTNWEYLLGQTIQVSTAPGNHYNMVSDPQAYTLAIQVQQWLQSIAVTSG